MNLRNVVLDLLAADKLVHINVVLHHAEGEAIGLGDVVNIIGRNQRTGPRHILYDKIGTAGNVLGHVPAE